MGSATPDVPRAWRKLWIGLLTFIYGGLLHICLPSASATGAELPAARCAEIRSTRDALVEFGVVQDMERGPQWAGENLAADRLARIRQFVTAQEQVLFRCDSIPRELREGMKFAVNVPTPKPFYERLTFPLPVRKPVVPIGLRTLTQE